MREWMKKSEQPAEALYSLIPEFVEKIPSHSLLQNHLQGHLLYRVFYYDARPFAKKQTNPLNGTVKDYAGSDEYHKGLSMLSRLENMSYVAVRQGKTEFRGWEVNLKKAKKMFSQNSQNDIKIDANDVQPRIEQKGVDMRIGLDIAALSLKQFANVIVLIGGDSDFVPALKFARTEGRQVILLTLGHEKIAQELKIHTDICIELPLADIMES